MPRAAVPPKLADGRIVLRIGPEFGMPGSQVKGFGLRSTIPPWKLGLNSLRITVPESKRSMKFRRWTYHKSDETEKFDDGEKINPRVCAVDFSGCRFGFDWIRVEMLRLQSSASPPGAGFGGVGQRTGSTIPLFKACTLELEDWKSDGAREARDHVPPATNTGVIHHLAPAFGGGEGAVVGGGWGGGEEGGAVGGFAPRGFVDADGVSRAPRADGAFYSRHNARRIGIDVRLRGSKVGKAIAQADAEIVGVIGVPDRQDQRVAEALPVAVEPGGGRGGIEGGRVGGEDGLVSREARLDEGAEHRRDLVGAPRDDAFALELRLDLQRIGKIPAALLAPAGAGNGYAKLDRATRVERQRAAGEEYATARRRLAAHVRRIAEGGRRGVASREPGGVVVLDAAAAIPDPDRLALVPFGRNHHVIAVLAQGAEPAGSGHRVGLVIAVCELVELLPVVERDLRAAVVLAKDDVDHACDRIP